jgi:hypothetical protein
VYFFIQEWRAGQVQLIGDTLSTGAQYVTPNTTVYCEQVKICLFSSGNWFFCTKFVQFAVAGKMRNTGMHLQKKV